MRPWINRNGPALLHKLLKARPDLEPFTFILNGPVPPNPPGPPPPADPPYVTSVLSNRVQMDADFYALSSSLSTWDDDNRQISGYHDSADSPDLWEATLDLQEGRGGKRYTSQQAWIASMFGSGELPFHWPVPMILRSGTELRANIHQHESQHGEIQDVRLAFHGFKKPTHTPELPVDYLQEPRLLSTLRRYRERGELGRVEPYFLTFNFLHVPEVGIPGMTTLTKTVRISGADFAGCYMMGGAWDVLEPAGNKYQQPFLGSVHFSIDQGDDDLFDRPVQFPNVMGTGRRPNRFAKPLILKSGQTITAFIQPQKQSTTLGGGYEVLITLAGVRIFPTAEQT